ncbi:hypothetical protein F4774DRAFT_428637 [Daldinia eschscholtzii]|nr:hypothetical protein F4774DRAFT_428637 [Daldinia eschscholtzii]
MYASSSEPGSPQSTATEDQPQRVTVRELIEQVSDGVVKGTHWKKLPRIIVDDIRYIADVWLQTTTNSSLLEHGDYLVPIETGGEDDVNWERKGNKIFNNDSTSGPKIHLESTGEDGHGLVVGRYEDKDKNAIIELITKYDVPLENFEQEAFINLLAPFARIRDEQQRPVSVHTIQSILLQAFETARVNETALRLLLHDDGPRTTSRPTDSRVHQVRVPSYDQILNTITTNFIYGTGNRESFMVMQCIRYFLQTSQGIKCSPRSRLDFQKHANHIKNETKEGFDRELKTFLCTGINESKGPIADQIEWPFSSAPSHRWDLRNRELMRHDPRRVDVEEVTCWNNILTEIRRALPIRTIIESYGGICRCLSGQHWTCLDKIASILDDLNQLKITKTNPKLTSDEHASKRMRLENGRHEKTTTPDLDIARQEKRIFEMGSNVRD